MPVGESHKTALQIGRLGDAEDSGHVVDRVQGSPSEGPDQNEREEQSGNGHRRARPEHDSQGPLDHPGRTEAPFRDQKHQTSHCQSKPESYEPVDILRLRPADQDDDQEAGDRHRRRPVPRPATRADPFDEVDSDQNHQHEHERLPRDPCRQEHRVQRQDAHHRQEEFVPQREPARQAAGGHSVIAHCSITPHPRLRRAGNGERGTGHGGRVAPPILIADVRQADSRPVRIHLSGSSTCTCTSAAAAPCESTSPTIS